MRHCKGIISLLFLSFVSIAFANSGEANNPAVHNATVHFYGAHIQVAYHVAMLTAKDVEIDAYAIEAFYNDMNNSPYSTLLANIQQQKNILHLNDWLYYQLIVSSVETIFGKDQHKKTLAAWFLLAKSGYDARIAFWEDDVFLFAASNEEIYESPVIMYEGKRFVNLTALDMPKSKRSSNGELYILPFTPNRSENSFSFSLEELPHFTPDVEEKTLEFSCNDQIYTLSIQVDKTIQQMMENYPLVAEQAYVQAPLSRTAKNSLLPQLREIIADKSEKEALQIITAFTRSAFKYKEDNAQFGASKPMIADEVLLYNYSDCEDRTALFCNLVRELLHLPVIAIAYTDHLSAAVSTVQPIGNPVQYKGRSYYICDPTGPSNSAEIGNAPKELAHRSFHVLMSM